MEGIRNFNDIVAVPLTVYSYKDWFECVKNYLIYQDLWKVTNRSPRPERYRVKDFARWKRKNAAALHVINISCGAHNLPLIRGACEAKVAWDILYRTYNAPPPPPNTTQRRIKGGHSVQGHRRRQLGCRKSIPSVLDPKLADRTGETPLHLAIKLGHVGIVEELVKLLPPQYLETLDSSGNIPLLIAAKYSGVILAKCLTNQNTNALAIPMAGIQHLVPVSLAFSHGLNELGGYLYSVTPLHVFQPPNGPVGPTFLKICFIDGNLDIVLDLLQRCKELLLAVDFQSSTI